MPVRVRLSVLVMACALSAACMAPSLRTRYGPLHPETGESIAFRVQAEAWFGISDVELYLYEYEITSGGTTWSQRPGGAWGLVETKSFSFPWPWGIDETFVRPGFPPETFVRYEFRVKQAFGGSGKESWSLAAGTWSTSDPIPLLVNGPSFVRIDLCFVADKTLYADGRAMLGDLEPLIFDGFQASNAQAGHRRRLWQYFYVPETGYISPLKDKMEIPDPVLHSSTIDATCVVHKNTLEDWSSGPYFGTEPWNKGTAVHESGHAVFMLDDEYPCGLHRPSSLPHHNDYDQQSAAQAYNMGMGWPATDVEKIEPGWWRPEPASLGCIMFDDRDSDLPDFERTCIRRIDWFYEKMKRSWVILFIP